MQASQPCELCGCSEVNLHDGYYFCAECGTQDANFQETIIEMVELDGDILHGRKKKIHKIAEEQKEMSDAWYKWHSFNFLLQGVADELMEFGAEPSFKTKLLWVWTRYIKRYLKVTDMGLNNNPHQYTASDKEETDSDQDIPPDDLLTVYDKTRDKAIKNFSLPLFISLIYIALNLDKSVITLTHLMKLLKDGMLSVPYRVNNLVPKELKPEKLRFKIKRGLIQFKGLNIRFIAMTLFKRLDLGNPVLPDLRLIIDNHLKELCLPTDLKPLVLSLMHYKPCNFLDVNSQDKVIWKIPAYEFHVMTYIIWALKLCLGLDCEYEIKLSSAAEAINEEEDRPKSYFMNGVSAPTNRLFSFREWISFFQFRQIMLRHYCFRFANKCSWDTDDYIALEHHIDLFQGEWNKGLRDEMAYDLLNRIKGGEVESMVIPKDEFKPTITPFHSYSLIVAEYLQDPEVKLKLTEDFSQYSLKYVIDDWNLVNPKSKKKRNLVRGIKEDTKIVTNEIQNLGDTKVYSKKMVYVKNCENHNWLTTKPPTIEQLVKVDKLDASDDDLNTTVNGDENPVENAITETSDPIEKNNEVDSKTNSLSESSVYSSIASRIQFEDDEILQSDKLDSAKNDNIRVNGCAANYAKFPDVISDKSFTTSSSDSIRFSDDTKVFENSKLDEVEREKLRQLNDTISNPNEIKEEPEDVNIFDDDFKPIIKNEMEDCEMNFDNTFDNFQDVPISNDQTKNDSQSDMSTVDSVVSFNEATFDRAGAIKELILYTCKKHKLPLPKEYNEYSKKNPKKEMGMFSRTVDFQNPKRKKYERNHTHERERRGLWLNYVTEYHALLHKDALAELAQHVNLAIQNANKTGTSLNDTAAYNDMDIANGDNVPNETLENDINDTINNESDDVQCEYDSDKEKLFNEDSDGETYAKDVLPEKNPYFDEEVYDPSQLFLKATEATDEGEMDLDPELSSIIEKKMAKDKQDPSLLTWTEEKKKPERCDSEDEMPLNLLHELNLLRDKLSNQNKANLPPFLEEEVENFPYWFKFYQINISGNISRIFEDEINKLPMSFSFILRQCAHILSVTEGELYRNLQKFEITATEKLKLKIKNDKKIRLYNEKQF